MERSLFVGQQTSKAVKMQEDGSTDRDAETTSMGTDLRVHVASEMLPQVFCEIAQSVQTAAANLQILHHVPDDVMNI